MFEHKKKIAVLTFSILLPMAMLLVYNGAKANVEEVKERSVGLLVKNDYKDVAKATQAGIKGYIQVQKIGSYPTVSKSATENNAFNITLTFVSYDPDIKTATVRLDPQNSDHKKYQMVKGQITCVINDYLCYSETGEITLESGKPYVLRMYINIPNNKILTKMYIDPSLGMVSDFPIIDEAVVKIDG